MSMFEKDAEIVKGFMMLRYMLSVLFVGTALLWFLFAGWVIWRLGPGGYSAWDAQEDRSALCAELDAHFTHDQWTCPAIKEATPKRGSLWKRIY